MLNSSRTGHYALRALMYLARSKGRPYVNPVRNIKDTENKSKISNWVKIEEVARNEDIPRNFLSKIFQILIKNGMVDSCLGPKGGVKLSSDSRHISVADVLTVINGRMHQEDCALFGYKRCPELVSCPIQNECQNVRKKIWGKLKKLTLNKLCVNLPAENS